MIAAGAPTLLVESAAQDLPPLAGPPLRACLGACAATPLGLLALHRAGLQAASLEAAAADGAAASCSPAAEAGIAPGGPPTAAGCAPAACARGAMLAALAARLGPCLAADDPALSTPNPEPSVVDELARAHLAEMLLADGAPAVLGAFRAAGLSAGAAAAAYMAVRSGPGHGPCSGPCSGPCAQLQAGAGGKKGAGAGAQALRGLAGLVSEALFVLSLREPGATCTAAGVSVRSGCALDEWDLPVSGGDMVLAAAAALQAAKPDVLAAAALGRLAEWVRPWVAGSPGHAGADKA